MRRLWFDRFQIAEDAPLAQAEAKWTSRFEELLGRADEEAAHVLGVLVGLPFADSPHIGAMRDDPSQLKGRALVVSRELLGAVRAQQPVVVLLEDLHWADQSSWEYLMQVVLEDPHLHRGVAREEPAALSTTGRRPAAVSLPEGEGVQHGLFILGAARPEWAPSQALLDGGAYVPIDLSPLSDEASRALARELLQNMAETPDELVELIVTRAEGVPYYAEELVNWCLDQGVIDRSTEPWRFVPERLADAPLPSTLQHLLLTRLSRLAETERAGLQRGAVFGRHFWTGGVEGLGVAALVPGKRGRAPHADRAMGAAEQ